MRQYKICSENFNISEVNDELEGRDYNEERTPEDQNQKFRNVCEFLNPESENSVTVPVLLKIHPTINRGHLSKNKLYFPPINMDVSIHSEDGTVSLPLLENIAASTIDAGRADTKMLEKAREVAPSIVTDKATNTLLTGIMETKNASGSVYLCPKHLRKIVEMQTVQGITKIKKEVEELQAEIKDLTRQKKTANDMKQKAYSSDSFSRNVSFRTETEKRQSNIVLPEFACSAVQSDLHVGFQCSAKYTTHELNKDPCGCTQVKNASCVTKMLSTHECRSMETQINPMTMSNLDPLININESRELVEVNQDRLQLDHANRYTQPANNLEEGSCEDGRCNSQLIPSNPIDTIRPSIPVFKISSPIKTLVRKIYHLSSGSDIPKYPIKPASLQPVMTHFAGA